jgi:hypothetical protein
LNLWARRRHPMVPEGQTSRAINALRSCLQREPIAALYRGAPRTQNSFNAAASLVVIAPDKRTDLRPSPRSFLSLSFRKIRQKSEEARDVNCRQGIALIQRALVYGGRIGPEIRRRLREPPRNPAHWEGTGFQPPCRVCSRCANNGVSPCQGLQQAVHHNTSRQERKRMPRRGKMTPGRSRSGSQLVWEGVSAKPAEDAQPLIRICGQYHIM